MADRRSVETLAFNFASRTFAYQRLAQGLSIFLSAFSSLMHEHLDLVIKEDECAQNVDDIGIATNSLDLLIINLLAVFKGIQDSSLKLSMAKIQFGFEKLDFFGRTLTPNDVTTQKPKITICLGKVKFPCSKKALQCYIGFLNYY